MSSPPADPFETWFAALEKRHLAVLRFSEVRRALQALSSLYVERRGRLGSGSALDTAGKRAAFALYYGPLHFLLVREIVRALDAAEPAPTKIVDLGCGTGCAGAAWALESGQDCSVAGVDVSGWATEEARWTYKLLGVAGAAKRGHASEADLPGARGAILAAFTVNELDDAERSNLLKRLRERVQARAAVLIVEPLARRMLPWWPAWETEFLELGGRADEWRFRLELPDTLRLLDRASGLRHDELTGRSLWIPRGSEGVRE